MIFSQLNGIRLFPEVFSCACHVSLALISGRDPSQETLQEMVRESPGPLNFTMFLTLFGDKLKGE